MRDAKDIPRIHNTIFVRGTAASNVAHVILVWVVVLVSVLVL